MNSKEIMQEQVNFKEFLESPEGEKYKSILEEVFNSNFVDLDEFVFIGSIRNEAQKNKVIDILNSLIELENNDMNRGKRIKIIKSLNTL